MPVIIPEVPEWATGAPTKMRKLNDFHDLTDDWVLRPHVCFWVPGKPRQQGSKRSFIPPGRTKPVVQEMAKGLSDWRHDVKYFAMDELERNDLPMLVDVPVWVKLRFVMPRSTSLPKRLKITPPCIKKTGDLDKLIRGIFDAVTGIVYADDCLVVKDDTTERTAEPGEQPGCLITIGQVVWPVEDE
jgi:crossover junction endodeoxyribonuclease RusA